RRAGKPWVQQGQHPELETIAVKTSIGRKIPEGTSRGGSQGREGIPQLAVGGRAELRACERTPIAFTLLELLVVIAIIGILAGLSVPVLNNFRPNYTASATAQLMDALSRARQLALSQRTTVYMVFVPVGFTNDPAFGSLPFSEKDKAAKLFDKQ